MKVVFLQDVPNVAQEGEIKEVADGFGRNFLLPKKLAKLATPAALKSTEAQRQALERQRERSEAQLKELAQKLQGMSITLKMKVGASNRLYGSIKSLHIAQELSQVAGFEVDKRWIELEEPIRELGNYEVPLKLGKDLVPKIKVAVEEKKE